MKTENSWKASTLTAVVDGKKVRFTNIDGLEGDIVISMVLELKSLVFEPDFYWKGIEAFEVTNFLYNPITLKFPVVNADDSKFIADGVDKEGKEVSMAPDMQCTYHLNPANAEVKADKNAWKFIAYNKATRATGNVSSAFNIISADLKTKGKVTIHSQYKGDVIQNQDKVKEVTVLALQYIAGDSVITSDYAAVQASKYADLVLNNPDLEGDHNHLYLTAKEAANAEHTVEVAWDNDKGIDLRQVVNTHYSRIDGDNDIQWDKNAASGTVEKNGFKYSFALVGYEDGKNKTSQSAHAAIAADGYTLRAQMTKDGKQQAFGAEQNPATVGREPLVRVLLTDTIHNNIAAVGYFKIKITPTAPDAEALTVDMPETEVPYIIECEGSKPVSLLTIAWHDVEEKILAKVGLSKQVFEEKYKLDTPTNSAAAYQFEKTMNGKKQNEETRKTPIGVITLTDDDTQDNQTEVLKWEIDNQDAYTLFKGSNNTKTLVTYVRFALKDNASAANQYIWVKFTWTPKSVNVLPATTFDNKNKIQQFWYDTNSSVAGSGYADIHGNVEVVGTTDADDEFVFNICNTLVGNELTTTGNADYAKVKSSAKRTFEFVSGTAGDNKLTASDDGKYLVYNKTNIAELNPETGEIEFLGYKDDKVNTVGKDLLNLYGHADLKNTLTAVVKVVETICKPFESQVAGISDKSQIPVDNNTFKVKLLRPITMTGAEADFEDAETKGSSKSLKLSFVDWRDHSFTDETKTKGENYYDYYGIKSIKVDVNKARTDLNGNPNDLLNKVTTKLSFKYKDAEETENGTAVDVTDRKNVNFGKLEYQNSGVTVGNFTVWFPIEITYDWGVLKAELKCNVGKTQANARQK
ncbi:MAG: hypothetical protein K2G91_03700 [Prevotella sp.]|nr:hypothetical protein [Prevotella sp.]